VTGADEILQGAAARAPALAAPELAAPPRRRLAVLSCMDARFDPQEMLGLGRGDLHVLRNAGGLVTDDAIRSLAASQRELGTEEVIVVMHERCGLLGASDDEFAAALAADGARPSWRLGGFTDLDATLREGLARLRRSAELPHRDAVRGFVFDPATGSLRDVEGAGPTG
jgi:carbonic anhydrase